MKRSLLFISITIFLFLFFHQAGAQTSQTVQNGASIRAINFPGTGCTYDWVNNTPGIGLLASGRGNILPFTAVNTGNAPVTATITATLLPDWFAYIPNEGDNTVSVIDITKNKLVAIITVGGLPGSVSVSADGGKVYVANRNDNTISVINTLTYTVGATINVGSFPAGVAASPDGTRIYVTNSNDNNLSIINTATNTVIATVAVGKDPAGVTVSPDGSTVYVANAGYGSDHTVSVINTSTNAVSIVNVGNAPGAIGMSPDGSKVYVANINDNSVSVINTSNNVVSATIPIGNAPEALSISPDGTRVYVANFNDNTVSVIDAINNVAVALVPVGAMPDGLSVSPDSKHVYVANNRLNNVSVIDAVTNAVVGTLGVGSGPVGFGNFITGGTGCSNTPITFTITVNPGFVQPVIAAGTVTGNISACAGTASSNPNIAQFTVSGRNLTFNIIATAPAGFEVSLSPANGYRNSVTLVRQVANQMITNAIVYVRSAASASPGYITGQVILTSTGAISQGVAITGIINALPVINVVSNQVLQNGALTQAVNFTGTGNDFNWVNDTPSIGLPASGTGDIAPFTAINNGTIPVIATISVTPAAISYAYIANLGSNSVSVINTVSNKLVTTIPVTSPFGVSVSPDGSKVYVTSDVISGSVSVINTMTNTVTSTIPLGAYSSTVLVSPDGSKLYVANAGSNTISVISTSNNNLLATIAVGLNPFGISISPDGSWLYVSNFTSNNVSVINATTNTVTTTIPVNSAPTGLTVSPDGARLYVVNQSSNNISVINTTTNLVTATIITGQEPTGVVISPDGSRLYVTNTKSNTVSVFNTATNGLVASLPVDATPYGISINADGSRLYTANKLANDVSVINTATNTIVATVPVGTTVYSFGNFTTGGTSCGGIPVSFTIQVNPSAPAVIAATGTLLPLSTVYGTASSSTNFTVSGINMRAGVSVTPPNGFEVSNNGVTYGSSVVIGAAGTITSTTIYIRLASSTPAGNYPGNINGNIKLSSAGAADVLQAMPVSMVIPADLTLTADNKSKFFGQVNPVLTVTYNGFVNNDTPIQLTALPAVITTGFTTSAAGQYPIIASGAASPNYNISYIKGVLTISENPATVAIPNTFTPNGDGINDIWSIKNLDSYINCTVQVYNRYGENVYSSNGYGTPWDGTYRGAALPANTYYYIINLKNGDKVLSGFVAIIR